VATGNSDGFIQRCRERLNSTHPGERRWLSLLSPSSGKAGAILEFDKAKGGRCLYCKHAAVTGVPPPFSEKTGLTRGKGQDRYATPARSEAARTDRWGKREASGLCVERILRLSKGGRVLGGGETRCGLEEKRGGVEKKAEMFVSRRGKGRQAGSGGVLRWRGGLGEKNETHHIGGRGEGGDSAFLIRNTEGPHKLPRTER